MNYRSDIDGLRAIAVLAVLLFHSGISQFSGGYVGVDVFFVISGFLITGLIYKEAKEGSFSYLSFYKRRVARLIPALALTLALVTLFGFFFYDTARFDILGKQIFFSSFGAANLLFSQGTDYFSKNESYQPLIHLWSLGVEEQFYLFWPALFLLVYRINSKLIGPLVIIMFFVSLGLSIDVSTDRSPTGYFLPHYRGFELLLGAGLALIMKRISDLEIPEALKQAANYLGVFAIAIPIFILDNESNFPGLNALWPCLGTVLIIGFPNKGLVTRALSMKWMVAIGLISYPLYLYHQPLISFYRYFDLSWSPWLLFFFICTFSIPASWLTYRYLEQPIRKVAHKKSKTSFLVLSALTLTIPVYSIAGIVIAKTNGLEMRFTYLNLFSEKVIEAHTFSFHEKFQRGINTNNGNRILFIGDSVLQQYVDPITTALKINPKEIDSITRGGCVLLKGVDFIDSYSDISCNHIRERLYDSRQTYDYVVISQLWESYGESVRNLPTDIHGNAKWASFIDATINHFTPLSQRIIIIGRHLDVGGTSGIQPTLTLNEENYIHNLDNLHITNLRYLEDEINYFSTLISKKNITVLEPYRIFCSNREGCVLSNDKWSFFRDRQHTSAASTPFVSERIKTLLDF